MEGADIMEEHAVVGCVASGMLLMWRQKLVIGCYFFFCKESTFEISQYAQEKIINGVMENSWNVLA